MRILHIIQTFPPEVSGAGMWCKQICEFLSKKGHTVNVLTLEHELGQVKEDIEGTRIIRCKKVSSPFIVRLKQLKPSKLYQTIRYIWEKTLGRFFAGAHSMEMYVRIFKEIRKTDIVHLHIISYFYNFIAFAVAKYHKKRIVITPYFHQGNIEHERRPNFWLLKKCHRVFAMTDYEKTYFIKKGIEREKIFVTPFPIDLNDYIPEELDAFKKSLFSKYQINDDAKIIIYVGRKQGYKGVDTLIEAIKKIKQDKSVKLLLVGPGSSWFNEYYSKLCKEDKDDIIDLGCVTHSNKVNLLHISNLLALPSKYESLGVVFLEALACGLPVVGSDVANIASIIDGCGYTFRHKDIDDLSQKISTILDNRYLSDNFSKMGKEKINRYVQRDIRQEILDVYSSAC